MSIVIKLNGKEAEIEEGTTVGQLLDNRRIRREMVTVQVNGVIIDRSHFDTTPLKDGDEVEFLYYMGGGIDSGVLWATQRSQRFQSTLLTQRAQGNARSRRQH